MGDFLFNFFSPAIEAVTFKHDHGDLTYDYDMGWTHHVVVVSFVGSKNITLKILRTPHASPDKIVFVLDHW